MTIQRASVIDQPAHYLEGADFQIVVPEESTNLIANPSFETNTAGWTASLVTLSRSTTQSFFGAASLKLVYGVSAAGSYAFAQINVSASTLYTLSGYAFVESAVGAAAGDAALAVVDGATTLTKTGLSKRVGHWVRYTLTFRTGAATSSVYVDLYGLNGTVYWDGVQLEAKPYATTYIDGEQDDCIWTGAAHGSSSYRPVTTRKGGRPVPLKDYKFKVAGVIGASMASLTTIATPYANIGGAYYQRSVSPARTVQIAGQFECNSHIDLMRQRAALIDAVNPNRTPSPQPARLLYTPLGCNADEPSRQVVIDGVYAGGLEGNQTNEIGVERAVMSFNVYLPWMAIGSGVGDRSVALTTALQLDYLGEGFQNIAFRNEISGEWNTLSSGANNAVLYVLKGVDGLPYVIGAFTSIGGVSANYVAKWDGSAFVALSTGPGGAPGFQTTVAAFGPDNALYYSYNTSATNARVRKWDGASWSTLADFTHGSDARVYGIKVAPNGNIYAAGKFTNAGGTAITNIAKYNGSAWSALGTAPNDVVLSLAIDQSGNVYAGGQFTSIGGVSAARVAKYSGSAWTAMGSGMTISAGTAAVRQLYIARDGRVYASGDFDTAGGTSAANVAFWNGGGWFPMGAGIVKYAGNIESFFEDDDAGVLLAGYYYVTGNANITQIARWNGSTWLPGPVYTDFASGHFITTALPYSVGNLYAGTATDMIVPAITDITTTTTTNDLRLTLTGPGTPVSLENLTTGDQILFNVTLNAGETATLTLGQQFSFVSNFRGEIPGAISAASGISRFRLAPGVNKIALMVINTTGASAAALVYKEMYSSLDAPQ